MVLPPATGRPRHSRLVLMQGCLDELPTAIPDIGKFVHISVVPDLRRHPEIAAGARKNTTHRLLPHLTGPTFNGISAVLRKIYSRNAVHDLAMDRRLMFVFRERGDVSTPGEKAHICSGCNVCSRVVCQLLVRGIYWIGDFPRTPWFRACIDSISSNFICAQDIGADQSRMVTNPTVCQMPVG